MPGYSVTLRNNQLDEITTQVGASGLLRWFSGTRPATGGAETTLLAECPCSATFAPAASGGVLTINPIASETNAPNSGTPTWARFTTSGGGPVVDLSAGVGSGEAQLDQAVVAGGQVDVSSATATAGNA